MIQFSFCVTKIIIYYKKCFKKNNWPKQDPSPYLYGNNGDCAGFGPVGIFFWFHGLFCNHLTWP